MSVYYNEIDPYCCAWLRNLIAAGHLPAGDVDERDIRTVGADDLRGYSQAHFFAGIGGWPLALELAGWGDRPVWTGSCPCQPFSAAGKGKAGDDERHLWPEWFRLIRAARPATIFGEQVDDAVGWGWLDLVHTDMEPEGYAVRSAVLPACSVGAPHIRQRLWFVADADGGHPSTEGLQRSGEHGREQKDGRVISLGNAELPRLERYGRPAEHGERPAPGNGWTASLAHPWSDLIWLPCTDGKQRPTKSGVQPLAHGISARVAKLRAAGNAITPQCAAAFIKATM